MTPVSSVAKYAEQASPNPHLYKHVLPDQKVSLFMDVTSRGHVDDLDDLVRELSAQGISEEDAECLIAFVPMAFARVLLSPLGVKFQDTFLVKDFDSGTSVRGTFANEPIHAAALQVGNTMASGDADSRLRFEQMAATSAEYDVVRQHGLRPHLLDVRRANVPQEIVRTIVYDRPAVGHKR